MKEHPDLHGIEAMRALARDIAEQGDKAEGARFEAKANKMAEELKAAEMQLAARLEKRSKEAKDAPPVPAAAAPPVSASGQYEHDYTPAAKHKASK